MTFAITEFNRYFEKATNQANHHIVFKLIESTETSSFDDVFGANITAGKGVIYGNHPRALLLCVYEVLKQNGCLFMKPGIENEIIPNIDVIDFDSNFDKVETHRHRAICIEGAVSLENCLDMIDWAPKVGFNGYFIQFRTAHEFFERWYHHQRNPLKNKEEITLEDSKRFVEQMVFEIKKRHMIYHAVGHGWTNHAIGIDSTGWQEYDLSDYSNLDRNLLAKIKGERKFFNNKPLNTQLCYGNPKVVDLLVDEVVNYASKHKEIDILHFWLADDFNNFCECDLCKNEYPADLYVKMLNKMDEKLTNLKMDVKIAFLIYHELSWAPQHARIMNEDRFILMFAPISRTYLTGYKDAIIEDKVPDFILNDIQLPKEVGKNLAFLKSWQKIFKGDSFLFDYHLMWDEFKNYSNYHLSKIIYEDINYLKALSLNGYVSCQIQRNAFPNNLGMYVLSQALTTKKPFEEITLAFFTKSFGQYSHEVYSIIRKHDSIFSYAYARREADPIDPDYSRKLENYRIELKLQLAHFTEITQTYQDTHYLIHQNIKVFKRYLQYMNGIVEILILKTSGADIDNQNDYFEKFTKQVFEFEEDIQKEFDGFFFHLIVGDFIKGIN